MVKTHLVNVDGEKCSQVVESISRQISFQDELISDEENDSDDNSHFVGKGLRCDYKNHNLGRY